MHVHIDDAGDWIFPLFAANGVVGLRGKYLDRNTLDKILSDVKAANDKR